MNAVNGVMKGLVDVLMAPFLSAPVLGLLVLGILFGAAAAVVVRYTSNQSALKRLSDRVREHLLAIFLWKDDVISLRAVGGLLWASVLRIWYQLPPMLVMIIPFMLLLGQMGMYYQFQPIPFSDGRGSTTNVRVEASKDGWAAVRDAEIHVPEGMIVEGRVRIPSENRVVWRLRATPKVAPGAHAIEIGLPNARVQKLITAAPAEGPLQFTNPLRPDVIRSLGDGSGILEALLYPGEPAFAASSPVQRIEIDYADRSTPVLGLPMPWWLTFLLATFIGAFAMMPIIKVRF